MSSTHTICVLRGSFPGLLSLSQESCGSTERKSTKPYETRIYDVIYIDMSNNYRNIDECVYYLRTYMGCSLV